MGNFLTLVSVENTKLWKRLSSKIMIIILIAVVVGLCGLYKAEENMIKKAESTMPQSQKVSGDWQQQLQANDAAIQAQIDTAEKSNLQNEKSGIDQMKMQIAEDKYRIQHNIESDGTNDFWHFADTTDFAEYIALMVIIACSALVAGEFSEGTMKTMISRPFSRWELLTAKFVSVFIYAVVLTVIAFLTKVASIALFYGTQGFNSSQLLWIGGNVMNAPGVVAGLITAGLGFLQVIVYTILAFALCAIFRSRALATGLSIFLMFMGSLTILLADYFSWGKYILFSDTGFSNFLTGAPFYGITLGFALLISAAYCAVFLFGGYFAFIKRDIS